MTARFPVGPFESLQQKVWFGVEFVDPVTAQTIAAPLVVKLAGNDTKPIRTPSGRFAWLIPDGASPQTVQFEDEERRYAKRDYVIDLTLPLPRAPLFRLALEPTPGYAFDTGVTLLRGRVISTRPAAHESPRGVSDAHVRLRWRNAPSNQPVVVVDGPEAGVGDAGHFACPLPLPPGARPQRLDGELNVDLVITRRPSDAAAQSKTIANLPGLRQSRVLNLSDPIIWDEL